MGKVPYTTIGIFLWVLTLRGLSLFFKILPISNTGLSAADILATVCFNRGTPPLKFPHILYLGERAAEKPSTFKPFS